MRYIPDEDTGAESQLWKQTALTEVSLKALAFSQNRHTPWVAWLSAELEGVSICQELTVALGPGCQLGERVSPLDGEGDMVPAGASQWTPPPPTPSRKVPLYLAAPPPRVLGLGRQPPPGSPFLSISTLKLSFATSSQNHVLGCLVRYHPHSPPVTPRHSLPECLCLFVLIPTGALCPPGTELPAQKALLSETTVLDVVWVGVGSLCWGWAKPL